MRNDLRPSVMILAAGEGRRLRPLTYNIPKPLIQLKRKPLLGHLLDKVAKIDVTNVVVNAWYKADSIIQYLQHYSPETLVSYEPTLLETAGGLRYALDNLPSDVLLVMNSDMFWEDKEGDLFLSHLLKAWDPQKMDALLGLVPLSSAYGFDGKGDYNPVKREGNLLKISWRGSHPKADYAYMGAHLVARKLIADLLVKPLSNKVIWDQCEGKGRLYGLPLTQPWYHIGTCEGLQEVCAALGEEPYDLI